jgi:SPP1 family phage portal protein
MITIKKIDKEVLSNDDILSYMANYETNEVREFNELWRYYLGENVAILNRKAPDPNNPSNNISISYGRKLITTYTGYGYRPKYITIKRDKDRNEIPDEDEEAVGGELIVSEKDTEMDNLLDINKKNKEHIRTNRAGRNTAIFGVAYEIVYFDAEVDEVDLKVKAIPKFISVDPREMILIYNFDAEPKKICAIHFYKINTNLFKVEVLYKDKIMLYDRVSSKDNPGQWVLKFISEKPNFFGEVPVPAYYFGDELLGIIRPVKGLIDAYDTLNSDSMNEFDRFSHAYLVMKKYGLTDPMKKKEPGVMSSALRLLKFRRIFEHLPADADIRFLTKDIPATFIKFMTDLIREQIHIQSHVPDFTSEKMAGASGIAIQRLMFDFENVVSSAEADFDVGLIERMELLAIGMKKINLACPDIWDIIITHKRNLPLNMQEFAQTALTLSQAGFSRFLIADFMPDDIVPNVEVELARQKKDQESMYAFEQPTGTTAEEVPGEEVAVDEEVDPEEVQ